MKYTKPIYTTEQRYMVDKDTFRPYGERIRITSEKRRKEIALELLGGARESKEELNQQPLEAMPSTNSFEGPMESEKNIGLSLKRK